MRWGVKIYRWAIIGYIAGKGTNGEDAKCNRLGMQAAWSYSYHMESFIYALGI